MIIIYRPLSKSSFSTGVAETFFSATENRTNSLAAQFHHTAISLVGATLVKDKREKGERHGGREGPEKRKETAQGRRRQ